MNINQLKYFCAVCDFQTVSDAAMHLHISQPSISSAIKDLENEFGVTLFKRHHHGMTLTSEGELLYKMSKDILNRTGKAEKIMKDLGGDRKKLRLGIPPMIGAIILPSIYRDFLSANEGITLEIVEGGSQELTQKLSEGYLDMIFVPHNRTLDTGLSSRAVARLEIVCCMAKDSFNMTRRAVKPSDLENIPLVLFENSFFQTEEIKKWFARERIKPNILLQTEQLSTMLSIISNNIASGFMFRQLIERNSEFVSFALESPMYVDVSLVWKKGAYSFLGMQRFKEYMSCKNPFEVGHLQENLR